MATTGVDLDTEDIFSQSLELLGEDAPIVDSSIAYGPLVIKPAEKEGKANTLLADHLFSPALVLAERIERGLLDVSSRTVVELGAGTALPSLLAATLPPPQAPSLVVVTDHPDRSIIEPLRMNVQRNRAAFFDGCPVRCEPYEWGADTARLLKLSSTTGETPKGYSVVILSDLLHFDASRDVLLFSLTAVLAKTSLARAYVAAGTYTSPQVCDSFLRNGEILGLEWHEEVIDVHEGWIGKMEIKGPPGLDFGGLSRRKGMVRLWIGKWSTLTLADVAS